MAESAYVAPLLYTKRVPGACSTGHARNVRSQLSDFTISDVGSFAWPTDIVRRSFTRTSASRPPSPVGRSSGKIDATFSSTDSFPSATSMPIAVEVKLLLSE